MARRRKPFSYKAGAKGFNRVRAFEKRPGAYYIEYQGINGRRVREVVHPATPDQARWRAEEKAAELSSGYTGPSNATLKQILDAYHRRNERRWSEKHRRGQESLRKFWLERLGENFQVNHRTLTPAIVEDHAKDAALERGWTGRTEEYHLKYMRAAIRWAKVKARLIDHDYLDGVTYPKYDQHVAAYTNEELDAISLVAHQVDTRFAALWEILRDTGRRVGAVRKLEWQDLDGAAINFPAKNDKGRRYGRAFVSSETAALIRALPNGVPWVFKRDDEKGPVSERLIHNWLRAAEDTAGVEHLPGRGYHGVKRRVVTELRNSGLGFDQIGAVTGNKEDRVLRDVYNRTEDSTRMAALDALRRGRNGHQTDT